MEQNPMRHVVIIGGGFAGLFAAQALGGSGFSVTLLDRRNFHLFQPLLYQVATGALTPGDIATPQRVVLRRHRNVRTIMSEVQDIDPARRRIHHEHGELAYDILIVATGVQHSYFGMDQWSEHAPGLKTLEHALEMRRRIFSALERAEIETDPVRRRALMTFAVVGAGPTGVELAGAIGELANRVLVNDFRAINSRDCRILLIEGAGEVLPGYACSLRKSAKRSLETLGVTVLTDSMVKEVTDGHVRIQRGAESRVIDAGTILWAAGVKASSLGAILAARTSIEVKAGGRLRVASDLSLPGHPEIFVIGDLAYSEQPDGKPVPGLAPAAIQAGEYVARLLRRRALGKTTPPFRYRHKGSMAVIGRNHAVGDLNGIRLHGFAAWFLWAAVHIWSLIQPEKRFRVMWRWSWKYLAGSSDDRLITGLPAVPCQNVAAPLDPPRLTGTRKQPA